MFTHKRLNPPIAILLLTAAGLACSMLRPKRPLTWHVTLEVDTTASDREAAVRQTIEVIRKRLNAFGLSNFDVQPQGAPASGRILVSLPDVSDRERLKNVITEGGKLEMTHVISPPSPMPCQTYANKEEAIASLNRRGTIPVNSRVLPYVERAELRSGDDKDHENESKSTKWVVVESPAIINGTDLRNASALPDPGRGRDDYEIQFSLNKTGADKFGAWTGVNINEYIGVVLNDEVKSIAFIKSQIVDQGVITGRFTKQSAEDLALILRSGALPAPVKIVDEANSP